MKMEIKDIRRRNRRAELPLKNKYTVLYTMSLPFFFFFLQISPFQQH